MITEPLIEPFGIRVVIEADEPPKTTKDGLWVPEGMEFATGGRTLTGTILAVGEGVRDLMQPGDRVLYSEYAYKKLSSITGFGNTKQIVILADQIIGKIKFEKVEIGGYANAK